MPPRNPGSGSYRAVLLNPEKARAVTIKLTHYQRAIERAAVAEQRADAAEQRAGEERTSADRERERRGQGLARIKAGGGADRRAGEAGCGTAARLAAHPLGATAAGARAYPVIHSGMDVPLVVACVLIVIAIVAIFWNR